MRAFTTRACHSHLSRRCRSKQSLSKHFDALFLAAGELFFQRRQFGERRIGIGRTIALARRCAGRPLTVRRTTVALVTAALVASAEIATLVARTTVAIALVAVALVAIEFVAAVVVVAALAFETLARGTILSGLLARFNRRCALC